MMTSDHLEWSGRAVTGCVGVPVSALTGSRLRITVRLWPDRQPSLDTKDDRDASREGVCSRIVWGEYCRDGLQPLVVHDTQDDALVRNSPDRAIARLALDELGFAALDLVDDDELVIVVEADAVALRGSHVAVRFKPPRSLLLGLPGHRVDSNSNSG